MSAMTKFLLGLFPGCSHRSTTFPLTPVRNARSLFSSGPMGSRTYVVCLECGKEFPYNWGEMRIEKSSIRQLAVASDRSVFARFHFTSRR
jgi:RNase P subunit RPR2